MKRLLIMDDERDFAELVGEVGAKVGYEVRIVTQVGEFESAYWEFDPTVVVMDIVMPQINGIELVRWMANVKSETTPPFFCFSSAVPDAKPRLSDGETNVAPSSEIVVVCVSRAKLNAGRHSIRILRLPRTAVTRRMTWW